MNKYLILTILFLVACGQSREGENKPTLLSHFVSITDNEDKGIKEIIKDYGGQCKYSVGTSTSTDKGNKKYFELEMSKSALLDKLAKLVEMPASNIAYIFYRNLKDEKKNYTHIKVVINLNNGDVKTYEYPITKLDTLNSKVDLISKVSDLTKEQNYHQLYSLFDLSMAPNLSEQTINDYCSNLNTKCGQVVKFQFGGFSFFKNSGKEFLKLAGIQQREKENIPLSLVIDPTKNSFDNSIVTMKFEF